MSIRALSRFVATLATPRRAAVLVALVLLGGVIGIGMPRAGTPGTPAEAATVAGAKVQRNAPGKKSGTTTTTTTRRSTTTTTAAPTTTTTRPSTTTTSTTTSTAPSTTTTSTTRPSTTTTTTTSPPPTSTTTTTTTAPPPPPSVKPQIGGVCDRQHEARSAYLGVVNCFVVQADWSALQPTEGGPIAANNVIDQAIASVNQQNAANPGLNLRIKLRVYAGVAAPDWAKQLDGAPVTLKDPQTGAPIGTVPRFWTSKFGAAYDNLMQQLAGRYDSAPALLEVAVSRCTTQFAEPFLRQANDPDNRAAYLAAGYTTAQDEACLQAQLGTHARLWQHTRSGVAFSPFQTLDSSGVHQDEAFTEHMMDYCRQVLGSRCVLGNNTISWPVPGGNYTSMYQHIAALGGPIYFQTATAAKIGDWQATLNWAVEEGAGMIELPAGYDPDWALSDLAGYDSRLEANAGT